MATSTQKETLNFQAEVKQLLDLMVHSLYSHKEVFLRELISNASDACDKKRFEALGNKKIDNSDAQIYVDFDEQAQTVTVSDNGIGMIREEVIENLGTIAKSGTREFLNQLSKKDQSTSQLIGQFGVGFYSSFIVADKVTVETRRADQDADAAVRWQSTADGEFTIEGINKAEPGTTVILHLKKEEIEFLNDYRLKNIIHKYSDHIATPILMKKVVELTDEEKQEKDDDATTEVTYETINKAKALWTQSKDQIDENDYKEFYKHVSHDFENPLTWTHNKVEGKLEYTSLLYIPARAPMDLWQREGSRGLKLYVKRVFIMDDAEAFLPLYLRFVKGVIDSNDLPLNVSRELLQNNKVVEKIRSGLVNRILTSLEKIAKDKADDYLTFWNTFGRVLKEGPAEDFSNKDRICKLLRFASTHSDENTQNVSLEDYVRRMKTGQEKIYYVSGNSYEAAKNSPHLEVFKQKGIEVLIFSDQVDEWLVTHMSEFDGKTLQSVAKGTLDLGDLEDETSKEQLKQEEEQHKPLIEKISKVLSEKVKEVRLTNRLTTSPACIVADENDITGHMRQIFESVGQSAPLSKPIFEINAHHGLVKRLDQLSNDEQFEEWVSILFDQAVLAEGGQLQDPATFVSRLNKLFSELT